MAGRKKKCPSCGRSLSVTNDYYSTKSPMFAADGRINICKDCFITNSLDNKTNEVDVDKFKIMLMRTDYPFYLDVLKSAEKEVAKGYGLSVDSMEGKGSDVIKRYMKNIITLKQFSNKRYKDSEDDGFVSKSTTAFKNSSEIREQMKTKPASAVVEATNEKPVRWSKTDKQNKKYVISMVGYNPFENVGLNEEDEKYCFNIMAGYCDTDGIVEDGHKMQGAIEMTLMYCQCRNITEAMNIELSMSDVDDSKIAKLTQSKTNLLSSISTIAKDNNIASNYNKNSKQGQNSLSSKIKEMQEVGFTEADVNLFDIRTSEAFKQIDEISNSNIAKQLTLDSNDYTEIIKEQREMIEKDDSELDELREENRKLKNQILQMENTKG